MSYLNINGFDRELLSTRLSSVFRSRRPSSNSPSEEPRERDAERKAVLDRIARRKAPERS